MSAAVAVEWKMILFHRHYHRCCWGRDDADKQLGATGAAGCYCCCAARRVSRAQREEERNPCSSLAAWGPMRRKGDDDPCSDKGSALLSFSRSVGWSSRLRQVRMQGEVTGRMKCNRPRAEMLPCFFLPLAAVEWGRRVKMRSGSWCLLAADDHLAVDGQRQSGCSANADPDC